MLTPVSLLQECEKQQAQMAHDVFQFPPTDWAAFQNRLGQWQGIENVRVFLTAAIENDERKDDAL